MIALSQTKRHEGKRPGTERPSAMPSPPASAQWSSGQEGKAEKGQKGSIPNWPFSALAYFARMP